MFRRMFGPALVAVPVIACRVNGEFVHRDGRALEAPREDGYAFFAQIAFDDFARGELSTD